ncbi:MAG: 3-methyl-2-oxobutanoate hydroxymethyltransferase [Cellvibrionales bacterium TMED49]|nr:3-methyl-2-oxobutanoate hydroxymethyltransferase [Porticoccaceae bacterium]OUU39336.1 MAG: 3-methyl-2-oxobutanoate hydroxymethyltransferase [Cellvibrionales bacterium TMED49]|tara:strand:- start:825 stop:1610 length:786 start_codon:yes stop_codon:yes gene_type:complete
MVRITDLKKMKTQGDKFTALTAYDYSFAKVIEKAGIEIILIGDSLGNVCQGHKTTIPVSIDDMVYHTACVSRGAKEVVLIADMPFMSYETTQNALRNSGMLMQNGAKMVKLEGGQWLSETVYQMSERGIPVCGHLGLTPQSVHQLGGYAIQGANSKAADKIVNDAKTLEQAGAQLLVVECIPSSLSALITKKLKIPVIGIGAGPATDAQILVLYDVLGISDQIPSFSKNFLLSNNSILSAIKSYASAVRNSTFPTSEHFVQ